MANLTTDSEIRQKPSQKIWSNIFQAALNLQDWETLKPYPMLLYFWQGKHPKDMRDIAKWVSHFRLKHSLCKVPCLSIKSGYRDE